jgi:CysZ protein
MFQAAFLALSQMTAPPFRRVLLKAVGLALLIVLLLGVALHRLLSWLASSGAAWAQTWAEAGTGFVPSGVWTALVWFVSIAAGLGILTGAVFLMPAVAAFTGTFFVDEVAEAVERKHYPAEPAGRALPVWQATWQGLKTALIAIGIYLVALPFLLFAGLGLVVMFAAAAYLLSREYFLLAAMRFHPPEEAQRLRREHRVTIFLTGLIVAAFVSIPIVNLATPLFATAIMVHMHKRLAGAQLAGLRQA